jgi:hypothetical protein
MQPRRRELHTHPRHRPALACWWVKGRVCVQTAAYEENRGKTKLYRGTVLLGNFPNVKKRIPRIGQDSRTGRLAGVS